MMSSSSSAAAGVGYCVREKKGCGVRWVEIYMKDCLCNVRDEVSFGFGLISLVCWGVAEIPQIITNFKSKSSHGVSLAFLLTWVAGDVFNLVGCMLEPATLPTQYYTALLYTISTVVLVLQGLYYDHIYHWWKCRQHKSIQQEEEDEQKPLKTRPSDDQSSIPIPSVSPRSAPRREYYFTSARSMAASGTPPFRGYLKAAARSGPSAMPLHDNEFSSDDEAAPTRSSTKSVTQPRPIPRSVGYGTFLCTSLSLPLKGKGVTQAYIGPATTKLLNGGGSKHSLFGQWLGWLMAAIYMGGRLPQIWLNIKRGSVEGLNPLMFVFALVANVTYVLSIVVRTTEWDSIKPNMAWLLDAGVCVVLDFFIIMQYMYYKYMHKRMMSREDMNAKIKFAAFP